MGRRRRKNRTHLKGPAVAESEQNVPSSFVIKSGKVTRSISQLVRDVRKIMEPNTATRLRERVNARLRDYLAVAPSLGVTHLLVFTLTEAANVHLRIARLPQGPTLTFRISRYSLMKDLVNSALRNVGKPPGTEYMNPPLLVLNNFQQPAEGPALPQLKLMSTLFQGLFPAIQVEKSALPTFRRVLLISYSPVSHLISLRHYTITVRPHGVSRRVRKLLNSTSVHTSAKRPQLANTDDLADYLLRGRGGTPGSDGQTAGYDSMSETDNSEAESDSNAVELPEDYVGRGNKKGERKAVRLVETGPRIEMRLIKVVEGLVGSRKGEGETVFHEFVHKSKTESKALQKAHQERRKIKEARRAEQAANVARKKALQGGEGEDQEDDGDDDVDVEGLSDVDPEEALEKIRNEQHRMEEDEEEFDYEDGVDLQVEQDDEDWDDEIGVGEVSSEEESSEDEEEPVRKRKQNR
ncbi:hypothetical protein TREMEDRAFT_74754 [Tremella mesenterica DSM 1558]|uniref:uncharacterized protein n=1 Tax=Tremella mesenterica (strain ATCC 24925 / CBS 8224 / DSM 1558 / NBRC 9311 / NRRL Y-6157 / RJB 2259-6 / UBC 559-6) TaxID=578456 RepID=UPI00032B9E31|nr:uncharacterized protein TREMEDRAFT_74754 [Tremella mesenterica DSM 1558]EIW66588.1 hypothetical protein TREMEDRAFT_74754 [Tremella mesenterica DSM 1558]